MQDPVGTLQTMQASGIGSAVNIILTLPGPAYSIWRRIKKIYACPQCSEKIMLPSGKHHTLGGVDSSAKEYVIEIERKVAQMEQKLLEEKSKNIKQEVFIAKPIIQEVKIPPVKHEHDEGSKDEW